MMNILQDEQLSCQLLIRIENNIEYKQNLNLRVEQSKEEWFYILLVIQETRLKYLDVWIEWWLSVQKIELLCWVQIPPEAVAFTFTQILLEMYESISSPSSKVLMVGQIGQIVEEKEKLKTSQR